MKRKKEIVRKAAALVLASAAALSISFGADALIEPDIDIPYFSQTDEDVNVSEISKEKAYVGESVLLRALSEGLDESKCRYAFYVKMPGESWSELRSFEKTKVFRWYARKSGAFEFCVKIKCDLRVYKKYFKLEVTRKLVNNSLIGSSVLKLGDTLELSGIGDGEGTLKYAFCVKHEDDTEWKTLSGFGSASRVQWTPVSSGAYDICIKIKDSTDGVKKKYFKLNVYEVSVCTPSEFKILVKAPITSPYLWTCCMSDEEILDYTVTEKGISIDSQGPYVILEYRFRTATTGRTDLNLIYNSYGNKDCVLKYDVSVDQNFNYKITPVSGDYYDEDLPEPVKIAGSFDINLIKADKGYQWKYSISDNNIVEAETAVPSSSFENFRFSVFRSGSFTLTFTCTSNTDMTEKYRLIYDIYVDDEMNISVLNTDGIYDKDTEFPEIITG